MDLLSSRSLATTCTSIRRVMIAFLSFVWSLDAWVKTLTTIYCLAEVQLDVWCIWIRVKSVLITDVDHGGQWRCEKVPLRVWNVETVVSEKVTLHSGQPCWLLVVVRTVDSSSLSFEWAAARIAESFDSLCWVEWKKLINSCVSRRELITYCGMYRGYLTPGSGLDGNWIEYMGTGIIRGILCFSIFSSARVSISLSRSLRTSDTLRTNVIQMMPTVFMMSRVQVKKCFNL